MVETVLLPSVVPPGNTVSITIASAPDDKCSSAVAPSSAAAAATAWLEPALPVMERIARFDS